MGFRARSRCRRVSFLGTPGIGSVPAFLRRKAGNESGLTLLEVVIAMAILSVAVVGLVGGLSFVISVSDTLEEQAITDTLAARYVEEYLDRECPPEDFSVGAYRVEGGTDEGKYVARVSSEGEKLFELRTLAVEENDCSESGD